MRLSVNKKEKFKNTKKIFLSSLIGLTPFSLCADGFNQAPVVIYDQNKVTYSSSFEQSKHEIDGAESEFKEDSEVALNGITKSDSIAELRKEIQNLKKQNQYLLVELQKLQEQKTDVTKNQFRSKQTSVSDAAYTHSDSINNSNQNTRESALVVKPKPESQMMNENLSKSQSLHYLVYVFKSKAKQQQMWSLLDQNHHSDKWQGNNVNKNSYFIYVGAYAKSKAAQKLADQLHLKVGVKPVIYQDS